jgi:hypothetical protein
VSTDAATREARRNAAPRIPPGRRPALWVLLAAVPVIIAFYTVQIRAVTDGAVVGDLDIQLTLARLTAQGAVPLMDFEHGWNTASWYFSAALYELAGGNATAWAFLWGRVTGFMLAGFGLLGIAWRLRLPPLWVGVLVPAWLLLTHVPNSKYAIPLLWCLTLLPVGRTAAPGPAQALRVGLVATVWWFHVEMAVLLGAGTALYDLFGTRYLDLSERAKRVLAVGAGLVVGFGTQAAVYALLGLGPVELAQQLLFGQTETTEANFGYPLGAPASFRQLLFPASLLVAFVPAIWRRLADPTRFVALLHLSHALIGIRRTDFNHIAAASTLLALLVVLIVHDLVTERAPDWRPVVPWRRALEATLGVVWVAGAIAAGFRVESRFAIVGLTLACLLAWAAARNGDHPWASAGALLGLVGLMGAGLAGYALQQVRADEGGSEAEQIAAAAHADVDRCVGAHREAWVVPGPGALYDELDVTNPTPIYVFWYTLEGESDRVISLIEDAAIPAVIQVGTWPESMGRIAPVIEARYEQCATVGLPSPRDQLTVWTTR